MGVPEKVLQVIREIMKGLKTQLEVKHDGKIKVLADGSTLEEDSYSPVGFCSTEVPVAMLLEQTDGYKVRKPGERNHKRTHCLFIDDLKVYQENHEKLEIANELIIKASMDTRAVYGVTKCAQIKFKNGKMIKGEGFKVLEDRIKALDPNQNAVYTFLGCEKREKLMLKR